MQHDLAAFRSLNGAYSLESIWRQFSASPEKGFEKYFKPGSAAGKKSENQEAKKSDTPKQDVADPPPPSRSISEEKKKTPPNSDWNFGMFGSNKSSGSGGRPIGGDSSDKEKWLLIGALGVVALIGGLSFMEVGYREIGWKEFVNRLVNLTIRHYIEP